MPVRVGETSIGKIFVGATPVARAFLGSQLVFESQVFPSALLIEIEPAGAGVEVSWTGEPIEFDFYPVEGGVEITWDE